MRGVIVVKLIALCFEALEDCGSNKAQSDIKMKSWFYYA
jgi:hypothetical protein